MRYVVAVRRNIRRKFVSSGGMRAFSAMSGFYICRRPDRLWRRMAGISADYTYGIFSAGSGMRRVSSSWGGMVAVRHMIYPDGMPVEAHDGWRDADGVVRLAVGRVTGGPMQ